MSRLTHNCPDLHCLEAFDVGDAVIEALRIDVEDRRDQGCQQKLLVRDGGANLDPAMLEINQLLHEAILQFKLAFWPCKRT